MHLFHDGLSKDQWYLLNVNLLLKSSFINIKEREEKSFFIHEISEHVNLWQPEPLFFEIHHIAGKIV